jgi:ubiquinone/menaquinone biosynthesis C-methylase UbiE
VRAWAAIRPTAFPYFGRAILEVPRPFLTRGQLLAILGPMPGERILEIGPGTGYYSLAVAAEVRPGGTLDVLDVRRRFLDHTIGRARKAGLVTLGDGGSLPFPDGTVDAAFLVATLGEIPDPPAALRELRRVLKPDGRLVIGELLIDPDFPRLRWVSRHAGSAGLEFERQIGLPIAYFARFRPSLERAAPNSEGG